MVSRTGLYASVIKSDFDDENQVILYSIILRANLYVKSKQFVDCRPLALGSFIIDYHVSAKSDQFRNPITKYN